MSRTVAYRTEGERREARGELAEHLAGGGIVVYPTETVYGLGSTLDDPGLERLAAFKGDRPFLLLIAGRQEAQGLHWTRDARRLADAFWPGALTLALTAAPERYPPQVVGHDGGVAVRVSPHPAIRWILAAAGGPVTSTSANAPGHPPARDAAGAKEVAESVESAGGDVLVLDGGRLPEARPSTIVRCGETTRLLREGAISRAELETVVELE